jgi:hypothetical protein
MIEFGRTESCARCGSIRDVRVVKYLREQQRLTEPWCRPCRQQKLVRPKGKAQERRRAGPVLQTALLILAIAVLGGIVVLALNQVP